MRPRDRRAAARTLAAALSLAGIPAAVHAAAPPVHQEYSFDRGWRFHQGDLTDGESAGLPDSTWRRLSVPHDWSIEGSFSPQNPTGGAGGFLPAGVGWYRRHFTVPAAELQRRVYVEFDGVMANSSVWVNGQAVGGHPYGYVSFRVDLSGKLHTGDNVLAVRVDNSAQPASRYYAGAGINRHVRLLILNPLHVAPWGLFVHSGPLTLDPGTMPAQTAAGQALVQLEVENELPTPRRVRAQVELQDPAGRPAGTGTATGLAAPRGVTRLTCTIPLTHASLWNLDRPALYRAAVRLQDMSTTGTAAETDEQTVQFGVREARFDTATGFWLNGQNLKLKGVCLHQEAGSLGTAVPPSVWEQRIRQLKAVGCNAVRIAHNPPDPQILDVCDRLGMLVMDELFDTWTHGKEAADYHLLFNKWAVADVRDTVRRDRNHPSVILYSAGNEIRDTTDAPLAHRILSELVAAFHEQDPTRPVTQALFRPNTSHDYENGLADLLDVVGQNYRENELLAAHESKPTRKIVGTENGHDRRGWLAVRDNPAYAGQFLWTGFDYLGEARAWPAIGAASGLFDRTGRPHPLALERQSWWSDQPVVHIARRLARTAATPSDPGFAPLQPRTGARLDWTPANLQPHPETVEVYSNCDQVELLLNNQSLGSQPLHRDASPRTWTVNFAPGVLRAVASNHGVVVAQDALRTAGAPQRVELTAARPLVESAADQPVRLPADAEHVLCLRARVVDAAATTCPDVAVPVSFSLDGPGEIVGVDNGDTTSHESFRGHTRTTFQGECVVYVRGLAGPGTLRVAATAPGLAAGSQPIVLTPPTPTALPPFPGVAGGAAESAASGSVYTSPGQTVLRHSTARGALNP